MPAKRSAATIVALAAIVVLFSGLSSIGITWGLPSRRTDAFLFGNGEPWSGEKIYRLSRAGEKFAAGRGADVDADPLGKSSDEPIPLTATEEDVAKIYLRYRLYTHQPDEMITMMALAEMRPSQLQFDPQLYQYGGLFIYPIGALIKLAGMMGLIDVRSDIVFYLDNPDEFGKFYVVARAYSAAWGALGIVIVFGIARRLRGDRVGLLAALLFALLPVVACMSHEGKPHLPGAVLMLAAAYFAMRWATAFAREVRPQPPLGMGGGSMGATPDGPGRRNGAARWDGTIACWDWVAMCICCGAAVGMVLSSWPIMVLIPLAAWFGRGRSTMVGVAHPAEWGCSSALGGGEKKGPHSGPYIAETDMRSASVLGGLVRRVACGTAVAFLVYCITNPYVVINVFVNRDVLRSNFGNSLAMYQIARVWEGLWRVLELTIEGATLPVVVLGVIALGVAVWRRERASLVLAVPAIVFFFQFSLIGAGKPAEYGRFGIFYEAALVIGAACCLVPRSRSRLRGGSVIRAMPALAVTAWVSWISGAYLRNFAVDVAGGSRVRAARGSSVEGNVASATGALRRPDDDSWLRTHCRIALIVEPAPYSCPPLPFDRCDVFLHRTEESAVRYVQVQGAGCAAYRTVEADSSFVPTLPRSIGARTSAGSSSWVRIAEWLWSGRDTPISWANKPVEVVRSDGRALIRGGFDLGVVPPPASRP